MLNLPRLELFEGICRELPDYRSEPHHEMSVLFVGNLSFFCEEHHLFRLFDQYGDVANVDIIRDTNASRRPLFAFVTLKSDTQCMEAGRLFNNHLFMGRTLR